MVRVEDMILWRCDSVGGVVSGQAKESQWRRDRQHRQNKSYHQFVLLVTGFNPLYVSGTTNDTTVHADY